MRPSRRLLLSLHAIFIFLLLGAASPPARAQAPASAIQPDQLPPAWNDAVHALAEKIAAAAVSTHKISLDIRNISTLSPEEIMQLRERLEAELTLRNTLIASANSAARDSATPVQVTFSENVESYVWIAESGRDESRTVTIVSLAKATEKAAPAKKPSFTLQRNIVKTQFGVILDFEKNELLGGLTSQVRVLSPVGPGIRDAFVGDTGAFAGSTPLAGIKTPRDQRGIRQRTRNGESRDYLPGVLCVSATGLWSNFECGLSQDQAWPVGDGLQSPYIANRNYFVSFVEDENSWLVNKVPFYSVASYPLDHGHYRILAELDGKARLYEAVAKPVATFSGWGDNILSIRTTCDKTWKVLVTGTGDWTQPDRIQIYEITGHQAATVGQPLEFPGPITAMWPSEDAKSARVVSRNLQTGMYEASIVSVSCSD